MRTLAVGTITLPNLPGGDTDALSISLKGVIECTDTTRRSVSVLTTAGQRSE